MFTEDLRSASRRLWRARGFAIVAVAMLALGIGVNVAMFTVANTVLFKGFAEVRENDRILYLTTTKIRSAIQNALRSFAGFSSSTRPGRIRSRNTAESDAGSIPIVCELTGWPRRLI